MSQKIINIYQLKAAFSSYAREVQRGNKFIIAMRNKPFAELCPLIKPKERKLRFGVLKGQFTVDSDFDSPLKDFEADYYGEG